MVIKTKFLAELMTKLGHKVKAELVIDDSNGVSLTFPDISDIAEIAEGVAVDAPDGTYVVADGEGTLTVVVLAGTVASVTPNEVAAEEDTPALSAEVEAVLEAVVEANVSLRAEVVALTKDLKTLKASLKHEEEVPGAAAASTPVENKYKIV